MKTDAKIIPVILCGGVGTRLWPLSRDDKPKQFLKLIGAFSLFQETVLRTQRICGRTNNEFVFITAGEGEQELTQQLQALHSGINTHILCEPCPRNTAAAIALAAHYIARTFGEDHILWVLPTDHHIRHEQKLASALEETITAAEEHYLVTFGIVPTRPDTGYGYIRAGHEILSGTVFQATEFIEKPDHLTAQAYIEQDCFLWNSGMFVFCASRILESYRLYAPDILTGIIEATLKDNYDPDAERYRAIPEIAFDKAIMEKAAKQGNVAVIPCDIGWSDIGSWESLWKAGDKDSNGNVINGTATLENSGNCLVYTENRHIVCTGLNNMVIIESGDVVKIAKMSNENF